MEIIIDRINDAVLLEAKNEDGNSILMDGSPDIGGLNKGMRPMQVLLASLGGCSSMDVLSILRKQKQDILDYKVVLKGDREKEGDVSLFRNIHIKFVFKGNNLDPDKVERAIKLSMEKYCSVTKTLEPTAKITTSFELFLP
jgi:putative redox protein